MVGLAVLLLFLLSVKRELGMAENSLGDVMRQEMASALGSALYHNFIPSFAFQQEKRSNTGWILERQITELLPLYGFALEEYRAELWEDEGIVLNDIMLEEARAGNPENGGTQEYANAENGGTQEYAITENGETQEYAITENVRNMTLEELLQIENENLVAQNQQPISETVQQTPIEMPSEDLQNNQVFEQVFVPHTQIDQVDRERLGEYETLVQDFYTIDKNTMAGSDQLDAAKLLQQDLRISKEGEAPQILIYHTHSQEGFADSVPGDSSTTIMGVGDRLAQILQDTYGYKVLHHMGQYDVDSRDDAYSRSLPAIEQVLEENPSIQVIIDLHRDEMAEETRLVMDLDGRPTARFMFFNGLSRTRKTGNISYLYNEYQEENLAFSFQMQLKAAEYYPGLTRKIYLKGYRYNMHLRPRTLLVELGAQNNTLEEAMNACDPLAHILDMVLSGY